MTVDILCPGPSLPVVRPQYPRGDIVIAVNRAAHIEPPDWLSALDWPLLQEENLNRGGRLITCLAAIETVPALHDWYTEIKLIGDLMDERPGFRECSPGTFSACAALFFAHFFDVKKINVFGADWTDENDWDGKNAKYRRDKHRWEFELRLWNSLAAKYDELGIEVNRVRP